MVLKAGVRLRNGLYKLISCVFPKKMHVAEQHGQGLRARFRVFVGQRVGRTPPEGGIRAVQKSPAVAAFY